MRQQVLARLLATSAGGDHASATEVTRTQAIVVNPHGGIAMPADTTTTKPPVVFVHGLWLHAESWKKWVDLFRANGYPAIAASWPGDSETTEATRRNAGAVAGHGVAEIADHIAAQLSQFDKKAILVGH